MANAAEKVYGLVKRTVEDCGVELWDVRYLKEGASWYLRIYIDKPDGITIDDCTNVSHAIDPVIDASDPIDGAYYLEVCSPGIERELTRPEHYAKMAGKKIRIKLYKASEGKKEFEGILKSSGENIVLETETGEIEFELKEISKSVLCDL